MDWLTFFLSILAAAFTGTVASLVAPWSQWGAEKSKLRTQKRRKLVDSWYKLIDDYQDNDISIIDHKNYTTLRQHLSSEAITEFEIEKIGAPIILVAGHHGVTADRKLRILLSEVRRIEAKWGLV